MIDFIESINELECPNCSEKISICFEGDGDGKKMCADCLHYFKYSIEKKEIYVCKTFF